MKSYLKVDVIRNKVTGTSLALVLLTLLSIQSFGQGPILGPAIYYLVDTALITNSTIKTKVQSSGDMVFVTFDYPHLKDNTKPTFRANTTKKIEVFSAGEAKKKLHYVSQKALIEMIKKHRDPEDLFYNRFYLVFKQDDNYTIYKGHFLGEGITIMY